MKTHTSNFKEEIKLLGKQQDVRITYTINNEQIVLSSEDINSVTPNYEASLLKSVMKVLELDSNVSIPKDTEIKFEYGLLVNGTYEYLDYGNYIVAKEPEKQEDTLSYKITCYDKMLYSMKDYEHIEVNYPCKIKKFLIELCKKIGLEFKDSTFANQDREFANELFMTINEDKTYSSMGYTYRDVLDQIAETTGGCICMTLDDKVEVRYINETNDTIDEEYINDTNVNFGEKYGPINSIVLARAGESDKIYKKDQNSIDKNGLCELMIKENQFMNFNDRVDYFQELSDKLFGVEYYLNDFVSTGIMYYDLLDMYNIEIFGKTYNCLMLNDEQNITQGLEENIHTDRPETSETDYTKADKTDRKINQTTLIVDKQNQKIEGVISQIGDRSEKTTTITADIDGINSKVEQFADLTRETSGTKTIELENCAEGELYELHIFGNNTIFDTLYPSDTLYPHGDSYIIVTDKDENKQIYELGITEVLRQKNNTYDEYILKDGEAQIIRRINKDGSIKDNEEIENLGRFVINLKEGNNTIEIKNYSAQLKAKWIIKNDLTDVFVPNVSLGTKIVQNSKAVQIAWNQISEKIQADIVNNKASLSIYNENDEKLMNLDEDGQHFYANNEIFGNMGIAIKEIQEENNEKSQEKYITFSVTGDYGNKIENGMAWGIKTKSDNKFYPIFYIKNFSMGDKDSETGYGELVLDSCDIVLSGLGTGLVSGNIKIYGDPGGDTLYFHDVLKNHTLMMITSDTGVEYGITILDKIKFYANQEGSNTLKVGDSTEAYSSCILTDDGDIGCRNVNCLKIYEQSLKSRKKNFEKFSEKALNIIKEIDIYKYNLKVEKDTDKKHIGFVIGDEYNYSKEITNNENTGVDTYSFISLCCKAIQEQQEEIEELKKEINKLKGEKI